MSSDSNGIETIVRIARREYSDHRWEYITFTVIIFVSFLFALVSELTRLNDVINYLAGGNFNLAEEIRKAPLEHFAPNTIAYGTTFLYLLISGFRILCGTNLNAVNWFKQNFLAPLTRFYSTLYRAMFGCLFGITILSFLFEFSSYLWIFFIFSFIYPGLIMLIVQSMGKLVEPIPGLKIDKGFWGSRVVGFLMVLLALLSGLGVYAIDAIGDTIL